MTTKQNAIQFIIGQASEDEIKEIIDAIKFRRATLARTTRNMVRLNQTVSFTSRNGKVVGTVSKINRKFIIVTDSATRSNWRVPANMLEVV